MPMPAAPSLPSVDANQDHGRFGASPRRPTRRVNHTYHNYSHFIPAVPPRATNFPSKLHRILSTEEFAHIISWMPHGRGWKIHDQDLLVREVVPRNFVQSRFEAFARQLSGWGFKRLHQSGRDCDVYYHECFLRGRPLLTALMKRVSPSQGQLVPHVEGEPDFDEIGRRFPLPPGCEGGGDCQNTPTNG